jgi:5-methylcytosine-specific restriction endonuclease McrA
VKFVLANSDFFKAERDQYGRARDWCRCCEIEIWVETPYHKMGLCADCARKAGNAFLVQHTGRPDQRLDPEGYAAWKETWERTKPYQKRTITHKLRTQVFERDGYACQHCGSRKELSADHVLPECKGGPTTLENLQTLCRPCNLKKGRRHE